MSRTYPYKYEVKYAAVRTIQSGSTHNIISFQTYGYNYEYTQHRVASINLFKTKPKLNLQSGGSSPYLTYTDYVPMMLK